MKRAIAVLGAAIILTSLVGCGEEPLGAGRLAESKAPAQLLRVEAVSRVPGYQVDSMATPEERSQACDPSDPEQKERFWRSSVEIFMIDNASVRPEAIVSDLVDSFVDQGWTATEDQREGEPVPFTLITSATSPVAIEVQQHPKTADAKASITIVTSGPCVVTDGEGSDEVLALEGGG